MIGSIASELGIAWAAPHAAKIGGAIGALLESIVAERCVERDAPAWPLAHERTLACAQLVNEALLAAGDSIGSVVEGIVLGSINQPKV